MWVVILDADDRAIILDTNQKRSAVSVEEGSHGVDDLALNGMYQFGLDFLLSGEEPSRARNPTHSLSGVSYTQELAARLVARFLP